MHCSGRVMVNRIIAKLFYLSLSRNSLLFRKFRRYQGDSVFNDSEFAKCQKRVKAQLEANSEISFEQGTTKSVLRRLDGRIDKPFFSKEIYTSGSTGEPFKFFVPLRYFGFEWIASRFMWSTHLSDYSLNEPVITFRTHTPKNDQDVFKIDRFQNFYYVSPYHISQLNLDKILNFIIQSKSRIVRGYPSSVYLLADLLNQNAVVLADIRLVVVSSEMFDDIHRNAINSAFPNASICNQYGQNEGVVALFTCRHGKWHNLDYYGKCEISDANAIIGTPFHNKVYPFYKYNTGDLVEQEEKFNCSCGLGSTAGVKAILGRSDDWLFKADGTKVPSTNFTSAIKTIEGIKQYQLIQDINPIKIRALIVLSSSRSFNLELLKGELARCVQNRLGKIQVEVEIVDEILRNRKTNKIKTVIRNE